MRRVATFMSVKNGMEERYRQEHRDIWPKVLDGITSYGIGNYSIFMRGRELYSYFEVKDLERAMVKAAADPINQQWQAHMAPLFDVPPGVKEGSTVYLKEVFYTAGDADRYPPLQRVATLMAVKEGMEEKYKQAHRDIWPEILTGIARAGISNYSIFMRGRELFSYFEVCNLEEAMAQIAADPDNQRWQTYMAPLFDVGPGVQEGSTVYLEEVFHLD
jgi:L-rhamnose mutarotase